MAERGGFTEQLKAKNQIEWVGRMNHIRNRATEIVNSESVCLTLFVYHVSLGKSDQISLSHPVVPGL
ncbi:MAG: TnpV protein [Candidatus Fimenecus sp.]